MKYIILIFAMQFCYLNGNCQSQMNEKENEKLARKMQGFFIETLKENYGTYDDALLYRMFFENFYINDGEYFLSVNRKKMAALNAELFKDSVYHYFYLEVYYVSTPDSIAILREKLSKLGKTNFSVQYAQNKYKGTINDHRFMVKFNENGFAKNIIFKKKSNSDVLTQINKFWVPKGKEQNMFEFIELVLAKPEELKKPEVKAFATLIFWKYLCYTTNYDLYGRKKTSKFDIY